MRRLKINPSIVRSHIIRSVSNLHSKTGAFKSSDDDVDFDKKQRFYEAKSLNEVTRALLVLKLSSCETFVKNSLPLMKFSEQILGERLFKGLMKRTIYSQFVAGEDYPDVKSSISKLQQQGIGTILCVPTEEDYAGECEEFDSREYLFDKNSEVIHECIQQTEPGAFSQMRISAICSPALLKHFSDLVNPYQAEVKKPDGFDINNLARGFDVDKYHEDLVPSLSENQNRHLQNSLRRMDSFAKHCRERGIRLLIDAEMSYIEGAIHQMILTLQSKHNKQTPWVYGTYQCYRKDTLDRIEADLKLMSEQGFHFGAKLVRGAYKEQEYQRSVELGFENPIHDSYEDTCKSYNEVSQLILNHVAHSPAKVMIATHNEESVKLTTIWMKELGIKKDDKKVSFAQLYGMCDQVSNLLGQKGYEVYKSVPYGPISSTLPYLARRAIENKDVTSRTAKERSLLWKEIGYRLIPCPNQDSSGKDTQHTSRKSRTYNRLRRSQYN